MITFTIPITPVPASRPRVTRWSTYYGKKYTEYKKQVSEWLITCSERQKTAIQGVVHVTLIHYLPLPKSTSKKAKIELDNTWCDKNADIDNLNKAVYDNVLNEHFINDDRYIVSSESKKYWTAKETGWTEITIIEL